MSRVMHHGNGPTHVKSAVLELYQSMGSGLYQSIGTSLCHGGLNIAVAFEA